MNLQSLFIFQLVADIVLCIAIFFVLYLMTRESKKNTVRTIDPAVLAEYQRLLDASQLATEALSKAMDDSRKALKEIAYALDEREGRLRALIAQSDERPVKKSSALHEAEPEDSRYASVLEMARRGIEKDEIVRISGLPRGEIDLIVELDRQKDESH